MAMTWHGDEAIKRVNAVIEGRLQGAAMFVQSQARKNISRAQPTKLVHGAGGGSYRRGLAPSQPGEFPKKVMGQLRQRITYEMDKNPLRARVGTSLPYGKYLELGTRTMLPRPWLLPTIMRSFGFIAAKFGIGPRV